MLRSCDHCCTHVEGLSVKLGGTSVLESVNLHVNCREIVAIVGPNGAGKTTLLRSLLGEVAYSGTISFRVKGRSRAKPRIGYVPQRLQHDADSPINVADLIALATAARPVWSGIAKGDREKIRASLASVEAAHLIDRTIGELSGGELQRVLLAMAVLPEPDLLLLDEPISNVDPQGLALFYRIVTDLRDKKDVSVLLVTHDLMGIAPHADRMILLNKSVVASGSPKEILANDAFVRGFGLSLWNISQLPAGSSGLGR